MNELMAMAKAIEDDKLTRAVLDMCHDVFYAFGLLGMDYFERFMSADYAKAEHWVSKARHARARLWELKDFAI
jgi:hypothetical protein